LIEAVGAPHGQGLDQGRALAAEVREAVARERAGRGWLAWQREQRRAHRSAGRALQRFVPQLHERLQGIADAARVPLAALELAEARERGRALVCSKEGRLEGRLELREGLEPRVRRSAPDAGGFPSVELTLAPLASAFAGVNAEGIAVACLEDGPAGGPSLRSLVQDVLFRTRTLESAVEHVRRRGRYLRPSGRLLVAHAARAAVSLEITAGEVRVSEPPEPAGVAGPPDLCIDARAGELVWRTRSSELRVRP
jgi:hypothetical protein